MNTQKVVTPQAAQSSNSNDRPCITCHGKKTVIYRRERHGSPPANVEVRCPTCGGTGSAGLRTK